MRTSQNDLVPAPALTRDAVAEPARRPRHFAPPARVETACWDVHEALTRGASGSLLDVSGSRVLRRPRAAPL